jgi:hypothetical protein
MRAFSARNRQNELLEIKSCLGFDPDGHTQVDQISEDNPLFVYIKIPGDLDPLDRWELLADPLQQALENDNLGAVTGGGSLSMPDEDGDYQDEFSGIDVRLYDAIKGLLLLRAELARLQAPSGTALLYELNGREWEEPVYRQET